MKHVLVDASSAILLHKADLLPEMQAAFDVFVTASVYGELTDFQRPGARTIVRDRREQRITIVTPDLDQESHILPGNLHPGERDTLLCYLEGGSDFVIIDDGRGAGFCRHASIPYLNALLCPRVLSLSGHLPSSRARHAMTRISDLGRYSEAVEHYARRCSAEELDAFVPDGARPSFTHGPRSY